MFRVKLVDVSALSAQTDYDYVFKGNRRPVSARLFFRLTRSVGTNYSRVSVYPLWKHNGALVAETALLSFTKTPAAQADTFYVFPRRTTDGFDHPIFPDGIRIRLKASSGTLTAVVHGIFRTV